MKAAESRATPTLIIAVVRGDHTLKSDFIYQCLEQETTEHEQTEQVVVFYPFPLHYAALRPSGKLCAQILT